jgi:hypothetical protein
MLKSANQFFETTLIAPRLCIPANERRAMPTVPGIVKIDLPQAVNAAAVLSTFARSELGNRTVRIFGIRLVNTSKSSGWTRAGMFSVTVRVVYHLHMFVRDVYKLLLLFPVVLALAAQHYA